MAGILISKIDGKKIVDVASGWNGTKYIYGGIKKTGADCSGSTWSIFKEAGFPYDGRYRPSSQFASNPKFTPILDNRPQEGDVAWWSGHVAIYAGNNMLWSAHQTGGAPYGLDPLQQWVKTKGAPKWYRYSR